MQRPRPDEPPAARDGDGGATGVFLRGGTGAFTWCSVCGAGKFPEGGVSGIDCGIGRLELIRHWWHHLPQEEKKNGE